MKPLMRSAIRLDVSSNRLDRVAARARLRAGGASVRLLLGVILALFVAIVVASGAAHAAGTTY